MHSIGAAALHLFITKRPLHRCYVVPAFLAANQTSKYMSLNQKVQLYWRNINQQRVGKIMLVSLKNTTSKKYRYNQPLATYDHRHMRMVIFVYTSDRQPPSHPINITHYNSTQYKLYIIYYI